MRNQVMKSKACSWALLTDVKSATDEKVPTDARNTTDVTGKSRNGSRNRLNSENISSQAFCCSRAGGRVWFTVKCLHSVAFCEKD